MADAFDTALADVETQRRNAVAAIAANGTAGAQALADANSQIGSLRGSALAASLAVAARRGVPGAAQAELNGMISRPYDMLSASTAQMAASQAQRQAALSGAVGQYFPQIAAAIPVARTALKSRIDFMNAEAAAKAREAAQGSLSDSELRVRLMGAGKGLRDEALGGARQARDESRVKVEDLRSTAHELERRIVENRAKPGRDRVTMVNLKALLQGVKGQLQDSKKFVGGAKQDIGSLKQGGAEQYAQQAGIDSGLDPDRVRGLINVPTEKAGKAPKASSFVRPVTDAARIAGIKGGRVAHVVTSHKYKDPDGNDANWYQTAVKAAEAALKSGESLDTFKKNLNFYVPKGLKGVKALVLAQYGPAFGRG